MLKVRTAKGQLITTIWSDKEWAIHQWRHVCSPLGCSLIAIQEIVQKRQAPMVGDPVLYTHLGTRAYGLVDEIVAQKVLVVTYTIRVSFPITAFKEWDDRQTGPRWIV